MELHLQPLPAIYTNYLLFDRFYIVYRISSSIKCHCIYLLKATNTSAFNNDNISVSNMFDRKDIRRK